MRKKRNLKKDFRFHDDITQSNLGLMAREVKDLKMCGFITVKLAHH
jgi:hypothetical protein